eukprot:15742788-Heterocapsa_arctica.AAC.1
MPGILDFNQAALTVYGHTDLLFRKFDACVLVVPGRSVPVDRAHTSRVELLLVQDLLLFGVSSLLRDSRRASPMFQ